MLATSKHLKSAPIFAVEVLGVCSSYSLFSSLFQDLPRNSEGGVDSGVKYPLENHVTPSARSSSQPRLYLMTASRAFSHISSSFILTYVSIHAHPLTLIPLLLCNSCSEQYSRQIRTGCVQLTFLEHRIRQSFLHSWASVLTDAGAGTYAIVCGVLSSPT